MVRLRLFVAWLMFAALPLQATASVALWLCHPVPASAAAGATAERHEGHPGAHGDHAAGLHGEATAGSHAAAGVPAAADDAIAPSGDGHRCASCAFCGHVLAQPAEPLSLATADSPQSPAQAPVGPVLTRGLPVPDKPPRA